MKTFLGVILVTACFVACTHSFPSISLDSDESDERKNVDTILVLPRNANQFDVMTPDTSDFDDSFEGFHPFRTNPFDGWLLSMQNAMRRLRAQMAGLLSRIPEHGATGVLSRIPEGANTTSTTKIIDGHIVTINETTYMDGDDQHGTLIRVRVIDVKPQNDTILLTESAADAEVTTLPTINQEESTTQARSVETVEDGDNEIPKNQVDTLTA